MVQLQTSHANVVKRVHWLRGRAQNQRWQEEKTLVEHEMQWTVAYFRKQESIWATIAGAAESSAGQTAYAYRQAAQWGRRAKDADTEFRHACRTYVPLIT